MQLTRERSYLVAGERSAGKAGRGPDRVTWREQSLTHLFAIGGVLLFQAGFSYAIILASSGNGSFVGLGAMLLAVIGVPVTALINFFLIRSAGSNPASGYLARLIRVSLVLPAAQLALLVLVSVFRL